MRGKQINVHNGPNRHLWGSPGDLYHNSMVINNETKNRWFQKRGHKKVMGVATEGWRKRRGGGEKEVAKKRWCGKKEVAKKWWRSQIKQGMTPPAFFRHHFFATPTLFLSPFFCYPYPFLVFSFLQAPCFFSSNFMQPFYEISKTKESK